MFLVKNLFLVLIAKNSKKTAIVKDIFQYVRYSVLLIGALQLSSFSFA